MIFSARFASYLALFVALVYVFSVVTGVATPGTAAQNPVTPNPAPDRGVGSATAAPGVTEKKPAPGGDSVSAKLPKGPATAVTGPAPNPSGGSAAPARPSPKPEEKTAAAIELKSGSAVLMEAGSGKIIFEKNSHERRAPASVTKLMTLVVAFDALREGKIKWDDEIVGSPEAKALGGSTMFLDVGERWKLSDIMKAVAIGSANDASLALAQHVAGSEEEFVRLMNAKAREWGMKDTHFANSHGLDAVGHLTTAYDLALLSREAVKYPKLLEFSRTYIDEIQGPRAKPFQLVNWNKLVRFYDGADGLKTGFTDNSLYTISATAKRGNSRFIAVLMGSPDIPTRYREASRLLDYGFANYSSVPVGRKGEQVAEARVMRGVSPGVPVVFPDDFGVSVEKGQEKKLTREITLTQPAKAPVAKGQVLGHLVIKSGTEQVGRVELVAGESVPRANLFKMTWVVFSRAMKF